MTISALKLQLAPYLIWIKIALLTIMLGTAFAGGYKLRDMHQDSIDLEATKTLIEERDAAIAERDRVQGEVATQAAALEEALEGNDEEVRYVTRTITVEVEKPVYRDAVVPDTGLLALQQARECLNEQRSNPGKPASEVCRDRVDSTR